MTAFGIGVGGNLLASVTWHFIQPFLEDKQAKNAVKRVVRAAFQAEVKRLSSAASVDPRDVMEVLDHALPRDVFETVATYTAVFDTASEISPADDSILGRLIEQLSSAGLDVALQIDLAELVKAVPRTARRLLLEAAMKPGSPLYNRVSLSDVSHIRETVDALYALRTLPMRPTTAESARKLWFGVPPVVAAFTGRCDELDALQKALDAANRLMITQAITGLGGVGKTQLAARYAEAHRDEYDIIAWIRAEDGGVADLADLAGELGEAVAGLRPIERRHLALERLRRGEERWLLVLDNIVAAAQLTDCIPRGGNGRVLVTSRNREVRQFGPFLALDVFDPKTAISYLMERAGRPTDRAGAERLARALGYLPLALSHAAAYCAAGTSFDNYLDLLDSLPAVNLFDHNPEVSYTQTVASTWKPSIQAASADAPLAADVLTVASNLAADAIPKPLFDGLIGQSLPLEKGKKQLWDAFNALARFSLAEVDDSTVSVHRLLAKVVRDEARAYHDNTAVERAITALNDVFPRNASDTTRWPLSEHLVAHVIAASEAAADVPDVGSQVIDLLDRACLYLLWAGGRDRARSLAQNMIQKATSIVGADDLRTLTARHYEASAWRQMGHFREAIARFEPLLADLERILGAEHNSTLTTRHDLAVAYVDAGRSQEAISIHEQVLPVRQRILGREHRSTLSTRQNLAAALHAAGRVEDAISIYEQVLADDDRILGTEHPTTLSTRDRLARAYLDAARVQEAIAILEPLLIDGQRILGAQNSTPLAIRNHLAAAYQAAGGVEEAISIYEPLLGEERRILGAEHPQTLATRHDLAGAYKAAGRVEEAISIYERVLTDRAFILGAEHPDTLCSRRSLAAAYRAARRLDEAAALSQPDADGDTR